VDHGCPAPVMPSTRLPACSMPMMVFQVGAESSRAKLAAGSSGKAAMARRKALKRLMIVGSFRGWLEALKAHPLFSDAHPPVAIISKRKRTVSLEDGLEAASILPGVILNFS